jgi:hypothetical protein
MIFLNDGGRGVYLADIIPVGLDPGVLEPEDLDDDDEIDMVIGNRGSGTVGILLWYGPGYYTLFSLPVGADPSSIETSDLDGDGDPDILVVAGAEDDRAVQILRNEFVESGVLNFSLAAVVAEDPNLRLTGANDLNSNGLPDIIAVNAGGEGGPAAQDAEDGTVDVLLNAAETCPADFDGDRHVNTADLLILLGEWGTDGGEGGDCDRDGDVDTADLLFLLADWGDCPGNYPCPWDFNNDDVVDELDQAILMDHWGDCPDPPEECPWDLNGDGVVDGLDLMEVIDHFGPCP